MVITIKGMHAQLTPEAHDSINDKIGSLSKYYDGIITADVEIGITSMHHQKGDIYRAEANVTVPGTMLRAEAETENLERSINEVRDKLKALLIQYKEKQQDRS